MSSSPVARTRDFPAASNARRSEERDGSRTLQSSTADIRNFANSSYSVFSAISALKLRCQIPRWRQGAWYEFHPGHKRQSRFIGRHEGGRSIMLGPGRDTNEQKKCGSTIAGKTAGVVLGSAILFNPTNFLAGPTG